MTVHVRRHPDPPRCPLPAVTVVVRLCELHMGEPLPCAVCGARP